jgi:hypothetical protein
MASTKTVVKMKPWQKVLTLMLSGKPVTVAQIDTILGKEIYTYRLSTYIWNIKTIAMGTVKAIKDGRKVTGYQLMNVADMKKYMDRVGAVGFVPGQIEKKPSVAKIAKLKDLAAKPVKKQKPVVAPAAPVVAEVKKAKDKPAKQEEKLEVVEVTEQQ